MVSCSSSSTTTPRPPVFTREKDIPPWVPRVSPVATPSRAVVTESKSPGFVPPSPPPPPVQNEKEDVAANPSDKEYLVRFHHRLRRLFEWARYSGSDYAMESLLLAMFEDEGKTFSEYLDWQPGIGQFLWRLVARESVKVSRSLRVQRLARIILKSFFLPPAEWE